MRTREIPKKEPTCLVDGTGSTLYERGLPFPVDGHGGETGQCDTRSERVLLQI
jgi:hypothetical protein